MQKREDEEGKKRTWGKRRGGRGGEEENLGYSMKMKK
jgi:hypothetical protein